MGFQSLLLTSRHRDRTDLGGTRFHQHGGAGIKGCSSGGHIVDQKDTHSLADGFPQCERSLKAFQTLRTLRPGLRWGWTDSLEEMERGSAPDLSQSGSEKRRLIEFPLPFTKGMQRNGHQAIELPPLDSGIIQRGKHQVGKQGCEALVTTILEAVNEIAHHSLVPATRHDEREMPLAAFAVRTWHNSLQGM